MPKRRAIFVVGMLAAVGACVVIFLDTSFLNRFVYVPVRTVLFAAASPVMQNMQDGTGVLRRTVVSFGSVISLKERVTELTEQNARLKSDLALIEDIKRENDDLRRMIDLPRSAMFDYYPCTVVGRGSAGNAWVMVSCAHTVAPERGDAVVSSAGTLIGHVADGSRGRATIELVTHSSSALAVRSAQSDARGVARGSFGIALVLDSVPTTQALKEEDTIVTVGDDRVPSGVPIAAVHGIIPSADTLFYGARLAPLVDLDALRAVMIVKPKR